MAASGAWRAIRKNGDAALRPAIEKPQENELTEWISALAKARAESPALRWGSYHNVMVQPRQLIFERHVDGERVLVAINAAGGDLPRGFQRRLRHRGGSDHRPAA